MSVYYEAGKYRAKIVEQRFGENNKNNPEVQLEIQLLGFYVDGEPQAISSEWNRTIFLTLTQATIGSEGKPGWVLETLRYLGFNGASFSQLDPSQEDHHSFVDLEIDALCQHTEYQGKKQEKWSVLRPGGNKPQVKVIEKKGLRALDAKFGKVLKSLQEKPKPVAATTESGEDQTSKADIPF